MANDKNRLDSMIERIGKRDGASPEFIEDVKTMGESLLDVGVPERMLEEDIAKQFTADPAEYHEHTERFRAQRAALAADLGPVDDGSTPGGPGTKQSEGWQDENKNMDDDGGRPSPC